MKLILTVSGTIALATTSYATTIFSDNFDSLSAGALSGQGGWGGPTGPQVTTDPGSFGFSGNIVEYGGSDDQETHNIGGMNDTGIATVEFDLRISGDSSYTYLNFGQSGVSVGVERGNMTLRGANGGTQNFDHNLSGDNIYHMILTVDPTAFSGAGSATITYAQYTAESTLGASSTAFSNVELDLDGVGKSLSDNTNFVLRMHNAGAAAQVDNLSITQVPEPSSTALLGLGVFALILRRRK